MTRSSSPTTATTAARWPSSRRPRRTPSAIAAARRAALREPPAPRPRRRVDERAVQDAAPAALSVASNSALILLKAIAGIVTGSVALLTEALHSATDLVASIVALFSLRAADAPADESHPYGHEKIEDMAAAIEGVLILVGSVVIAFEAVRHLIEGTGLQRIGVGIAVLARVDRRELLRLARRSRRAPRRPALRRWRPTRRT